MTSGESRTVAIIVGCDTDPDRDAFVGPGDPSQLRWRGMLEGIPALKESVARLRDDVGAPPRFTWLIRADEQVRALQGRYAWVVGTHGAFLNQLKANGDEIGWHPHFWRRDDSTGRWYQEIESVAWQVEMLHASHADLAAAGLRPDSVRMGWDYHNADTLAALDRLGVRVDFSALPGLRTMHGVPPARSENLFDWFDAPDRPYHPSARSTVRRPQPGEQGLALLEVPIFIARRRAWSLVAGAQLARKGRTIRPLADALRRPSYFINVTARPALFAPMLRGLRQALAASGDHPPAFATYFHPDELLTSSSSLYALENVRSNLAALVETIRGAGHRAVFQTAATFARSWVARTEAHA